MYLINVHVQTEAKSQSKESKRIKKKKKGVDKREGNKKEQGQKPKSVLNLMLIEIFFWHTSL